MKIPLSWIKQYTDINISNEQLIQKIFMQIGAVEHIEDLSKKYEGILIAEVKDVKDHPDAEKLNVYQIDIGFGKEVQVVAGDKTLEVGDKVAYFPPKTKVPYNPTPQKDDFIVQEITLRGVKSFGMMASERELDLGSDHTQIMRLPNDSKVGESFAKAFDLNDTVVDIENKALANRPDCFGILGIAREISGIQNLKFTSPKWYVDPASSVNEKIKSDISLTVDNKAGDNCPRFMVIVMDNIKLQESPTWLKTTLTKVGMKSINNIVDITNYLMLLTGQPLHAYDFDKLSNNTNKATIGIRPAKNDEKVLVLGNKTVELQDTITVITDGENPIGIGGMIGGMSTEIDENTKRIVIECASFNRYNIRKSSMRLGIMTEAVTRFTKGQDPNRCAHVIHKAIEMIKESADGKVVSNIIDNYKLPHEQKVLNISVKKLNSHLGVKLTKIQIEKILDNIEYEVVDNKDDKDLITLRVPTFRQDIQIVQDVYEDIGRQYGYNNILPTLPTRSISPVPKNSLLELKKIIRRTLAENGANEILTYNFVSKGLFDKTLVDISNAYHIKNPLSSDLEYMRTAIIPSILDKVEENIKQGEEELVLFEINTAHNNKELDEEKLPLERQYVGLTYSNKKEVSSYYFAKKYLESLSKKLKTISFEYELLADIGYKNLPIWIQNIIPMFESNRSAVVTFTREGKKEYLGIIGEYINTVISNLNLYSSTSGFQIDIHMLEDIQGYTNQYVEPSKYPEISQDLCFLLDTEVPYEEVRLELLKAFKLESMHVLVTPVDIYQGKKMKDKKQIAYRISLQHEDKTLLLKDMENLKKKAVRKVLKKFGGELVD